jgi:hypothetical protein
MVIKKREDFAECLQWMIKYHGKHPEIRLMQLLVNVLGANDPYYVTDEQLSDLLKDEYEKQTRD